VIVFVNRVVRVLAPLCACALVALASGAEPAISDPLVAVKSFILKQKIDKTKADWKRSVPQPPDADFSAKTVTWKLETNVGDIDVLLMPKVAPKHVTSTVYLTTLGFYDGTPFHRVIPGFMAQGGDPTGTGGGGPGYKYGGEFDANVKHDKGGLLSMANAGPNTDGSQFFLTFTATPWLDGKHTIFGEVVKGMDVLKKLEEKGTRGGQPTAELEIEKATIEVK
jgi:cyclophilin family peptidyl-prolyl cis-trans isomerase